eukprot:799458-Rhodomonas_salina.1
MTRKQCLETLPADIEAKQKRSQLVHKIIQMPPVTDFDIEEMQWFFFFVYVVRAALVLCQQAPDSICGGSDAISGGADAISGGADAISGGADSINGGADAIYGGTDSLNARGQSKISRLNSAISELVERQQRQVGVGGAEVASR